MTYTALKLPNEPIVVARVKLPLEHTLSAARILWREINQQADSVDGLFLVILDFSEAPPDFSDILLWIDERRTEITCQYCAPGLRCIAIGSHPMVSLAIRKIKGQLGDTIVQAATLDEALITARHMLALHGQKPPAAPPNADLTQSMSAPLL